VAADELSARLRELADVLGRRLKPQSIQIRPAAKWYKQPFMSPVGFVLENTEAQYGKRPSSVLILLPDGRLWQMFDHVKSMKDGEYVDLLRKIDDPLLTSRSGSVTIGRFQFVATPAGKLWAETLNSDCETYRTVDPAEAFVTIAANVIERGSAR